MLTPLLVAALWMCLPTDTTITLTDVMVTADAKRDFQMKSSLPAVSVSRDYIEANFSGSLMETLRGIPGVQAMTIGSGASKPVIRGLGFHRMVVTEDGIKHEGQQWGDDHGLEIDQFAIDRAEVVKGPAALLYGSDAIGGVLSLYTNHVPTERLSGAVRLFGRTNNYQTGLSAKLSGRDGRFFWRAGLTFIDYADYRVPTDSIQYYSYYIRLARQRLRNTAGRERDGSVMVGYAGYRFHTDVRISDSYSKSGFFANAHGLEVRLSDIDYDRSTRDIDLPFQTVNHLKVLSHTTWSTDDLAAEGHLAYQNNLREEHSEPVSHGYMPTPDGTLERRFNKSTGTAKLTLRLTGHERHDVRTGLDAEYQHNRRGGWGFILPDFEMLSTGLYAFDRFAVTDALLLNGGIRCDASWTHIHAYNDWFPTPSASGESLFRQRSSDVRRPFRSITWSFGVNYAVGDWVLKANAGKGFRIPTPKELGADGASYALFRYEQGNPDLRPEQSYQLDAGITWANRRLSLQVDPFVGFFPNYIYLNPTSSYMEGLQLYHYTQAEVFRWGIEAEMTCTLTKHWEAEAKGEYLYARQLSGAKRGYGLPFSPPWTADFGIRYLFGGDDEGFLTIHADIVGTQRDIVPPEKVTEGHWTLNAAAGKTIRMAHTTLKASLHADNLLNRRYYDHTSYYRLLDVPEPGRNISLMLTLEL